MTNRKPSGRAKPARPFLAPVKVRTDRTDRLPPHSEESERGVLGCILLSPFESMTMLAKRGAMAGWFYDLRHATLFGVLAEMHVELKPIDLVTLAGRLRDQGKTDEVGGLAYLSEITDSVPSAANLGYYLEDVHRLYRLRVALRAATQLIGDVHDQTGDVEDLIGRFDNQLALAKAALTERKAELPLKVRRFSDLVNYTPPPGFCLVGDNELRKGTEGLAVLAGPGGCGKSLMVATLALGGSIGHGLWMGRKIHRKFRTLIIQAENGPTRLKREVEALAQNHPEADLENHVFFTDPPEGGMAFGDPTFDKFVQKTVTELGIDLVVIDPWSHLGVKDEASEVTLKLQQIRHAVGAGEEGPCILIIAHTKKLRAEDAGKRGRALADLISGSVSLKNTSRCAYTLFPWSDDESDDRVLFTCAKLNDGANYAATVWHRRFGTFFVHDPATDPRTWGEKPEDGREKRKAVSREQLREIFGERMGMDRSELCKALVDREWCSYQTARRITGPKGYMIEEEWLTETPGGLLALQR